MKLNRRHVVAGTLGVAMIGMMTPVALASPGSMVGVVTLGQQKVANPVEAKGSGVELETKVPTDIAMQVVTFGVGGRTGWHHHPGVVLVSVKVGEVTVWDSDCDSTTYGPLAAAGATFTESGNEPLEVTSVAGATVQATFIVPQVAGPTPVLRIEDDVVSCPGTKKSDDDDHDRH